MLNQHSSLDGQNCRPASILAAGNGWSRYKASFDFFAKRIEICWLTPPFHQAGHDPRAAHVQDLYVAVELSPQTLKRPPAHSPGTVEAAVVFAMRVDRGQTRLDAADIAMGPHAGATPQAKGTYFSSVANKLGMDRR